jgi:hypothetical protein
VKGYSKNVKSNNMKLFGFEISVNRVKKEMNILDYDLSDIPIERKNELVKGFTEVTAKEALSLFMALGLKTHIEATVINDATGDLFQLSFKKVN